MSVQTLTCWLNSTADPVMVRCLVESAEVQAPPMWVVATGAALFIAAMAVMLFVLSFVMDIGGVASRKLRERWGWLHSWER